MAQVAAEDRQKAKIITNGFALQEDAPAKKAKSADFAARQARRADGDGLEDVPAKNTKPKPRSSDNPKKSTK